MRLRESSLLITLKNHISCFCRASAEINRVQATCKSELVGLQAAFKLEKAKNTSLQQNLEQKVSKRN